jgi:DNA-binding transcriptional LysR family regulator
LGLTGQGADIISGPLVVHNTLSLLALVQGGVGIAILPEFASRMAWKSVVFVPLLDTGVARTISMFEAPNLPASALVAALVGCVRRVAA